ncbi:MAG: sulfate adenylyltransferase, partial [Candidatus Thermoplasmatota archaeon]|nr:sulfate adenylyltransferase [Candidatus Thermoplasmatota archaeon]
LPSEMILKSYEIAIDRYYNRDRVLLAVLPAAMRYAGPREAIFHAIVRKNYGATHFIVGRDHAGVGSFYGPYDAQKIFDSFSREELGIAPLCFENAFYCRACGSMATEKTCGHEKKERIELSGTMVRKSLSEDKDIPQEVMRREVVDLLKEHYSK